MLGISRGVTKDIVHLSLFVAVVVSVNIELAKNCNTLVLKDKIDPIREQEGIRNLSSLSSFANSLNKSWACKRVKFCKAGIKVLKTWQGSEAA